MMAVATVAFCVGGLLVGGSGIFFLLNLGDLRALRTMRRVAVVPAANPGGGRVAFEGRTEYGPAGRQFAPVSGQDSAWFHVRLIREPTRQFATGDGPDYDVLLDFSSPDGFALADHSGRAPVDPAILGYPFFTEPRVHVETTVVHRKSAPRTLPPVVLREIVDDVRKNERLTLTETRVPRGVAVYALGRMSGGKLTKSRTGVTVFSTDSRERVIAARQADISLGIRLTLGSAVTGLVLAGAGVGYLTMLA
ncbi:hypothetical protein JIG36_33580 [Actinoplanes sp. LDG1-06]|uniref:RING-type E3 ubiquitin transferase n=1 Tax=Paractinoplanes ovalisporus TaxID=2810368 RepID=A0ABS2AM56_9ACTN|nr:hypothetical protein [Actinoplanes ovalisporus]MBM2620453.1 hypothetical protein [Actinoplanes ovalisporus]